MRNLLCAIAILGQVTPALASGGASCANDGGDVAIDFSAGITHGMGGPVFSLTATVDAKADAADDLRKGSFGKPNLAQYWLDDKEMKFLLCREREGAGEFGSVELLIVTKPVGDDITYDGTYKLTLSDMTGGGEGRTTTLEGKVTCSVE
ncbi:MAG: hypothetical protein AB7P20_02275 [Rhizobiaceae bacterium]